MRKSISIIGSMGVPARYGGFETLAENLSIKLSKQFDIHVFCSKKKYLDNEKSSVWENVTRHFINLPANGILSVLYDLVSIFSAVKQTDILLVLGGSSGIFSWFFRLFYRNKTIVFHPDGMEWKRSKWNFFAKFYLEVSIKTACRFSHHLIIDNLAMFDSFKKYKKKVSLIAYGGDQYLDFIENKPLEKCSYWLTIARAEPENNLALVAECFSHLKNEKWLLVSNIIDTDYGRHLYNAYSQFSNILFLNKEYDKQAIGNLFSGAKGYIHPHGAGGTNPSLVAAMWSKKILLCHDNVFNRATTFDNAEYFSDSSQLNSLLNNKGLEFNPLLFANALEHYSWEIIAAKYASLFNNL